MRKLALATTALPLLLGLAAVAQAGNGNGVPCDTTESAVLECKGTGKDEGGFEVFAFTNFGGHAVANFSIGDDCTEALNNLALDAIPIGGDGEGHRFLIDEVSTGTPDRTIYTLSADGDGLCPD